jgi:hypothetical protein
MRQHTYAHDRSAYVSEHTYAYVSIPDMPRGSRDSSSAATIERASSRYCLDRRTWSGTRTSCICSEARSASYIYLDV